jgi:hypothetical protein
MEVYKRETEEIIRRFRDRELSYPDCLAALDAALAGVVPYLTAAQLDSFRAITAAANDTVLREMEQRKLLPAQALAIEILNRRIAARRDPGADTPPVLSTA